MAFVSVCWAPRVCIVVLSFSSVVSVLEREAKMARSGWIRFSMKRIDVRVWWFTRKLSSIQVLIVVLDYVY